MPKRTLSNGAATRYLLAQNFCRSRNHLVVSGILLLLDNMGNGPMLDRATTESATGSLGGRANVLADNAHLYAAAESWFRFADRLDYSIRRWVIPPADDGVRAQC